MASSAFFRIQVLKVAAFYLRHFNFGIARWRIALFTIDQSKKLGHHLGRKTVTTKHGFRLNADLGDWIGQHIYATGNYEDYTAHVLATLVSPGDTILDIGANVGFFSLLAAKQATSSGRVISFEPVPYVREELRQNVELNHLQNIEIREEAVSSENGSTTIHVGPREHRGVSSIRPNVDASSECVEVRTVTVDSLLTVDELKRVALVKMDIEGAEYMALQGMDQLISQRHPDIIIEMSDHFLKELGSSAQDLYNLLVGSGYRMFVIEWDGLVSIDAWDRRLPNQFNALFTVRTELPSTLSIRSYSGQKDG